VSGCLGLLKRLSPPRGTSRLAGMVVFTADIEGILCQVVTRLHDDGYSWAEIGLRLGVTRQAAQQRWGDRS
jgi:hypothetical protein